MRDSIKFEHPDRNISYEAAVEYDVDPLQIVPGTLEIEAMLVWGKKHAVYVDMLDGDNRLGLLEAARIAERELAEEIQAAIEKRHKEHCEEGEARRAERRAELAAARG